MADDATTLPLLRAEVEKNRSRAMIWQNMPARGACRPDLIIGEGLSKKRNVKLPPIRAIFPDLLGTQLSSQQPFPQAQ